MVMIAGRVRQRWAAIDQVGKAAQPQCALEQEVAGVGSYSVAAAVGAEP
jgi:hypothetical protein